jgi:carbonic anhydrase
MNGYQKFLQKYKHEDSTLLKKLAEQGQHPEIMVVACCDSRVDPALLLQCDPGDLFVVRNVANIIPPYENDEAHHGTSAALEFGICYLNVKHLIILGHSQCGGIHALLNQQQLKQDDFISNWINLIQINNKTLHDVDHCAKEALLTSHQNCMTFPWLKQRIDEHKLSIHLWFFEIKEGLIYAHYPERNEFKPLDNVLK